MIRFASFSALTIGACLVLAGCSDPPGAIPEIDACIVPCFAKFNQGIDAIAFDADDVLLLVSDTKNRSILRVPKSGGEPTVVADLLPPSFFQSFAVGADKAFFVTGQTNRGELQAVALGGGPVETLGSVELPGAMFTDGALLLTATKSAFSVLALDGSPPPKIDGGGFGSEAIAIDDFNVFWVSTFLGFGEVYVSSRDGADARRIVRTNAVVGAAVAGDEVYVVEGGLDEANRVDGAVFKIPVAGGKPTTLLAIDNLPGATQGVRGIALDRRFVYAPLPTKVLAIPRDGGPPATLLEDHGGWIAEDESHVYVIENSPPQSATLFRHPKLSP